MTSLVACNEGSSNPGDDENGNQRVREVVVETEKVELQPFEEYIRVTGTVEALEDAVISAEVSGTVQSIVDRGTRVQRGAVLADLDDRMVRSSLEVARSNYELAEDALRRQEPLLEDSIISTIEYNRTRAQRDQARAQLEQAEKQLRDSRIEAPFQGVIEERMISIGELVNPGMPVLRLVNIDRVRINAGIPERYINDIRRGTPVNVLLKGYGGMQIESEIQYAGSVIVPETRTFPVEVVLQNREGLLNPEMVVNLEVTRRVWEDVLIVPRTVLVRNEEGFQLFVVRQQSDPPVAEMRRVKTGAASGSLILVEEGLEPGDEVIVTGQTNVSDGDFLRILSRRE
ncbi:MAG: efflux RND transporter periplasmic adaptor subunit [Balneolales bacterium]